MHKKMLALAACAALTVSLAGCMPAQNNPQGSSESGLQGLFNSGGQSAETKEPDTVELKVRTEAGLETVEAAVYTGSGYTIAIPNEGWERESRGPQWRPTDGGGAALTVRYYAGKKADEAAKQLAADEDAYSFGETTQVTLGGGQTASQLSGEETAIGEEGEEIVLSQMITYFIETEAGCYALLMECSTETAETYGGYLAAMANSFALVEEQAPAGFQQNSTQQ